MKTLFRFFTFFLAFSIVSTTLVLPVSARKLNLEKVWTHSKNAAWGKITYSAQARHRVQFAKGSTSTTVRRMLKENVLRYQELKGGSFLGTRLNDERKNY